MSAVSMLSLTRTELAVQRAAEPAAVGFGVEAVAIVGQSGLQRADGVDQRLDALGSIEELLDGLSG